MARITYLAPTFPPETSTGRLEFELCNEFARRGHQITVVTSFPRRYFLPEPYSHKGVLVYSEVMDGIRVIRVGPEFSNRDNLVMRGLEYFYQGFAFVVGGLAAGAPDFVLCTSPPLTLGVSAWFLGKVFRIPVIARFVDIHPEALVDLGMVKNTVLHELLKKMERFLYKHVERFTVLSEGYKKRLVGSGADSSHISVAPNWGSSEGLMDLAPSDVIPQDAQGKFIVTYAGLMSWPQDLDTVVEAAALIREHPEVHFLLVGDGPSKRHLQEMSNVRSLENIDFLPFQVKEDYLKVLQSSDVCVVSLKSSFLSPSIPSKMLDIMACGKAVVANVPAGEVSHLVKEQGFGIWVEPETPHKFAEAVLHLSRNLKEVDLMGRKGRAYLLKRFTVDACASTYEGIMDSLESA